MAHTPGPWVISTTEYEGRTKRYEVMQAGWSRVICNVHKRGKANGYSYTVPVEDNARLIADRYFAQRITNFIPPDNGRPDHNGPAKRTP